MPADIGRVAAEFDVSSAAVADFTRFTGGDIYAPEVGFANGFPVARDPKRGRTWLAHCYAMVGVGRDDDTQSSGTELYAVIGHAPRHLDRNVTLVGRVVAGIEHLSSLPSPSGKLKQKIQPPAGGQCSSNPPPCASAPHLAIDSPRPAPPVSRVRASSIR